MKYIVTIVMTFSLVFAGFLLVSYWQFFSSIPESNNTSANTTNKFMSTISEDITNIIPDTIQKDVSIDESLELVFSDTFDDGGFLEETGNPNNSLNKNWWLNSGAFVLFERGVARTLYGALPENTKWRTLYNNSKSEDTANGSFPQNIFRLVTREKWLNFTQQAFFRITDDHLLDSPRRQASNGLLFFNRYEDGDNLYYSGVRVDGAFVIKKKKNGIYYTLGYKEHFGQFQYDRFDNPNLLPKNEWIGLRSRIETINNNTVLIQIYLRENEEWKLMLEAIDDGKSYGGEAHLNAGNAGIRTDFMDVDFDDFKINTILTN